MSKLLPIEVDIKINGKEEFKGDIKEDLIVGSGDLNLHIDEVSARIARWGVILADAQRELAIKKVDHDKWLAEKKQEARTSTKKEFKSEKANVEQVMMDNVDVYAEKCKDLIDAEYNVDVIRVIVDAFKSKKDMLISLSANKRSEMERDMMIKDYNKKVNGEKL